jgi:hypothetical protein
VFLGNAGVLDHETGLVWDRSAQSAPTDQWSYAIVDCYHDAAGGMSGWRLPTEIELLTLLSVSGTNPSYSLPAGHPFTSVSGDFWWSSSADGTNGMGVRFLGSAGGVAGSAESRSGATYGNVWCVRGPG